MNLPASISTSYPFEGNSFKTGAGHNMHYLDEGDSVEQAPTLFLHGNPTWSFFYRKLILSFREHGRCIAPDHIGCGLSDKPAYPDFAYDLKSHAENIISLLDHLQVDRVSLVLHDWGGAIGMTAFKDMPERVEKIVLLNTAAFPSRKVPKRILLCRLPLLGSLIVRGLNGFAGPATWMAVRNPLEREIKNGFLHPYGNWQDRVGVWRFVRDIPYEENHPSLSLLCDTEKSLEGFSQTPSLSCWGMRDFCFHSGFLDKWETIWPNLVSHRLNDAGHYLLEDDFEGCRSKIEPFLFG